MDLSRAQAVPPPIDPSYPRLASPDAAARPSGVAVEVEPKPGRRRSFTTTEKLRIVRQTAACTRRGDVEALLRREGVEGIYSSLLSAWRKQIDLHGTKALAGRKPGRKPKQDAKDLRIAELEKRAAKLEAKLSLAGKLLDLKKKAAPILGIDLASDDES